MDGDQPSHSLSRISPLSDFLPEALISGYYLAGSRCEIDTF